MRMHLFARRLSSVIALVGALAFALALSACCEGGTCIKDPPCKKDCAK